MNVIVTLLKNPEFRDLIGDVLQELVSWNAGKQTAEATLEKLINRLAQELLHKNEVKVQGK